LRVKGLELIQVATSHSGACTPTRFSIAFNSDASAEHIAVNQTVKAAEASHILRLRPIQFIQMEHCRGELEVSRALSNEVLSRAATADYFSAQNTRLRAAISAELATAR
jgi:hypothetical protein